MMTFQQKYNMYRLIRSSDNLFYELIATYIFFEIQSD